MKFGIKSKNVISEKEEQSSCYIIELVKHRVLNSGWKFLTSQKIEIMGHYLIDELRALVRSITKSH